MDFQKFANDMKNKAKEAFDKTVQFGAEQIAGSSFTLETLKEFEDFIWESKQTTFTKEDGTTKIFDHTVIIIVWDEKSDFFKEALIQFPILVTKAFSQNIKLKLAKSEMEHLDLSKYKAKTTPALLMFTNEKIAKVIEWEENIEKITKSFTMDIVSEIEKY